MRIKPPFLPVEEELSADEMMSMDNKKELYGFMPIDEMEPTRESTPEEEMTEMR